MRTGTLHVLFGFFVALFVVSQANIIAALGPVAWDMMRLQTTLSPEVFKSVVDGWNPDELARYRTHFAWDSVHPLIYGSLLLLWTYVLHRTRPLATRTVRMLAGLAVLVPALDYVENAFHLYLDIHRGAIGTATVLVSGIVANLKWLLAGVAAVVLLFSTVRTLIRSQPRRKSVVASGPPAKPPVITPEPMLDRSQASPADDKGAKRKARSTSGTKS